MTHASGGDLPLVPAARPVVGTVPLAWAFLTAGALAFGGLGAALALLERELVERRGWLARSDVTDALAFTKPLPGSIIMQIVAFLAWRLGGYRGAAVASVAFIAPAFVLMVAATVALMNVPPSASSVLAGIQIAVVGLLARSTARLANDVSGWKLPLIALAALACGLVGVNAALVVLVGGVVAVVVRA